MPVTILRFLKGRTKGIVIGTGRSGHSCWRTSAQWFVASQSPSACSHLFRWQTASSGDSGVTIGSLARLPNRIAHDKRRYHSSNRQFENTSVSQKPTAWPTEHPQNANQEGNIASLLTRMVGAFASNATGRVFQKLSSPVRPPRCLSLSFPTSPEEGKRQTAAITSAKLSSEDDPVQILVAKLALGIVARAQFNEFGHLLVNALEFR